MSYNVMSLTIIMYIKKNLDRRSPNNKKEKVVIVPNNFIK